MHITQWYKEHVKTTRGRLQRTAEARGVHPSWLAHYWRGTERNPGLAKMVETLIDSGGRVEHVLDFVPVEEHAGIQARIDAVRAQEEE